MRMPWKLNSPSPIVGDTIATTKERSSKSIQWQSPKLTLTIIFPPCETGHLYWRFPHENGNFHWRPGGILWHTHQWRAPSTVTDRFPFGSGTMFDQNWLKRRGKSTRNWLFDPLMAVNRLGISKIRDSTCKGIWLRNDDLVLVQADEFKGIVRIQYGNPYQPPPSVL